jgi:hypothetical protein
MSKFLELIESKSNLYRVRLKVDPALCVNGEIRKHQSYEGFILAEKDGKKFQNLLAKYKVQNEGFFDTIGQNIKNAAVAVGKKLKDDVVSPFKDPKYNPFISDKNKVDTSESGELIKEIEKDWLDVKKRLNFTIGQKGGVQGVYDRSFEELARESRELEAMYRNIKKAFITKNESYSNSTFLNLVNEQSQNVDPEEQKKNITSLIEIAVTQTDLNKQLPIRNMSQKFIPMIQKIIEEENAKKRELRQDTIKVSAQDVWKTLVQKIEEAFKASRSNEYSDTNKVLWMYILAQPNQKIALTYNPIRQPQVNPQGPYTPKQKQQQKQQQKPQANQTKPQTNTPPQPQPNPQAKPQAKPQ